MNLVRLRLSFFITGGVAQMVERSLSMREVPGSIPGASTTFLFHSSLKKGTCKKIASSGNRTRAARVAGEHSTTEPTMQICEEGIAI